MTREPPLSGLPADAAPLDDLAQISEVQDPARLVLTRTVVTLLLGSTMAVLGLAFVAPEQAIRFIAPFLIALVALTGWLLLRANQTLAAKYVLAFGVWSAVTVIAAFTGGVRAPVVIGYPVIILMTAWIIHARAALAIAGLTVSATIGLMLVESLGIVPSYLPSSLTIHAGDQIVAYTLSFALSLLLLRAFSVRLRALNAAHARLQRQADELKETQTELLQAQKVALLGSWVYEAGTDSLRLSAECCRIFGLPSGSAMRRTDYQDMVHPLDQAPVDDAMCSVMDRGAVDHEHRLIVHGKTRWVRHKASLLRSNDDKKLRIVGTVQDISERKEREAALEDSEQRYRTAFQTSPDAVNINRLSDGVYLDVNDGFCRLTGWQRHEALGRTSLELGIWRQGQDRVRFFAALQAHGGVDNLEAEFSTRDGQILLGLMSAHVMTLDGEACVLSVTRDITQRKMDEQQINSLAFFDPLTHLPNRRLLLDRLRLALANGARHHRTDGVLYVDLDDFKTLNESLGHELGDRLLQQAATCLLTCVREGDTVGRLGGDKFAILLEGLSEHVNEAVGQAEAVGRKVLLALNRTYDLGPTHYHGSASVGITLTRSGHHEDTDEPLKRAELAMYQAKTAGRNTLRFFDPHMQATVTARAEIVMGLREAIQRSQFALHYQAQVVDQGRVAGVEGLIRWNNPARGLVPPSDFIPLAEETGLIIPLGNWVLETACLQLAAWSQKPYLAPLTISINVSARQFLQTDFVEHVTATLARTGAPANRLKLELTESLLVSNVEDVIAKMNALKALGVGFSLDDFGTGYSSLSYLKRLPLDQVKIDQGFVRNILVDANDATIAKMVVALANSLGLNVIAEGVETQAQQAFLSELGCHAYQGYLFNRPTPADEFEAYAGLHADLAMD